MKNAFKDMEIVLPNQTDLGKSATERKKIRSLTKAQIDFAQAIISGRTLRDAYRIAYPYDESNPASISASANKLRKHPLIVKMLVDDNPQTMVDDQSALRSFVMRHLLIMARTGKQEGSRLKALELVGRATNLFTTSSIPTPPPIPTAEEIKKELNEYLQSIRETSTEVAH